MLDNNPWINLLLILLATVLIAGLGVYYRAAIAVGFQSVPDRFFLPVWRSLNRLVEGYRSFLGAIRKKRQEKTEDQINRVLLPFDASLQELGSEVPAILSSTLRKEGESLIIAKKANSFSIMRKDLYVFSFGTRSSVNFTISLRDLPLIKEALVRLKATNPQYMVGVRLSTYLFKDGKKVKDALEYLETKGMLLGTDRQVMISFIPRDRTEEKNIISTLKDLVAGVPQNQLVWRYNNVHVYRTHRGDEDFQGELGFNVKESKNHALLVSSRRKIKGYERFSIEVVTW